MKILKQSILAGALLLTGLVSAQQARVGMKNMLKVGANVGVAIPTENTSAAFGLDLSYQHLVTPSFGLGIATGYTQYFGRNTNQYDNNNVGVVPLAALIRIYPKRTGFYAGADIGYGFLSGESKVASNYSLQRPDGGFYIKPEIGYHNRDWNFFIQYQKVFTDSDYNFDNQDYSVGALGVGVAYNIALGN